MSIACIDTEQWSTISDRTKEDQKNPNMGQIDKEWTLPWTLVFGAFLDSYNNPYNFSTLLSLF